MFEDDSDVLESPGWHGSPSAEQGKRDREEKEHRKVDDRDRRDEQREHKFLDERERDESRKGGSGPLVPERVLSSVRGRDEDRERFAVFFLVFFFILPFVPESDGSENKS